MIPNVKATVFEDGFEDAGFPPTPWTGTVLSGGTVARSNTFVKEGSYSEFADGVDLANEHAFAYKTITAETEYYMRCYVLITALPVGNDKLMWLSTLKDQTNGRHIMGLLGTDGSGNLQIGIQYHDVAGQKSWVTKDFLINTWYCVEVYVKTGPGNGEVKLWWEGVLEISDSNLINSGDIDRTYSGCKNGASGNWEKDVYTDSYVVDTSYIGLIDGVGEYDRSATQSLTFVFSSSRTLEMFRATSQAINFVIDAVKSSDLIRTGTQAIDIALQATGILSGIYTRFATLTLTYVLSCTTPIFTWLSLAVLAFVLLCFVTVYALTGKN